MADVDDDDDLFYRQPRHYRELPYDREVRERSRGCLPAFLGLAFLSAIVWAFWYLVHR